MFPLCFIHVYNEFYCSVSILIGSTRYDNLTSLQMSPLNQQASMTKSRFEHGEHYSCYTSACQHHYHEFFSMLTVTSSLKHCCASQRGQYSCRGQDKQIYANSTAGHVCAVTVYLPQKCQSSNYIDVCCKLARTITDS